MPGSVFKYAVFDWVAVFLSGEEDADPQGTLKLHRGKMEHTFQVQVKRQYLEVMESICKSHY